MGVVPRIQMLFGDFHEEGDPTIDPKIHMHGDLQTGHLVLRTPLAVSGGLITAGPSGGWWKSLHAKS